MCPRSSRSIPRPSCVRPGVPAAWSWLPRTTRSSAGWARRGGLFLFGGGGSRPLGGGGQDPLGQGGGGGGGGDFSEGGGCPPAGVQAGRASGRVPRRGCAADAARPLRHLRRCDGEIHQGMAVALND